MPSTPTLDAPRPKTNCPEPGVSATAGTRATPEDLRPGQLGPPVVNITNPTPLPDPAGLSAVLNAVTAANIFRDMSGLQGTQALAQQTVSETLGAATAAGQMANETLRAEIQRQMAEMQLAADVAKAAIGVPPDPDKTAGISGQGAKINQGKSMDDRGVKSGGASPAPSDTEGGDTMDTGSGAGDGSDVMTASGDQMPMSWEAAYSDEAALGYSPSGLSNLFGGLPVQPAVYHAPDGGGSGSGTTPTTKKPKGPPHVVMFDDILKNKVYPNDSDIAKVVVSDLTKSAHPKQYSGGYAAWTNSPTAIFVRDPATLPGGKTPAERAANLVVAAFHEGVHIHQFVGVGAGKPPQSYAEMMKYEMQAYDDTSTWLSTPQAASLIPNQKIRDARAKQQEDSARDINNEIDKRRNDPPAKQEAAFKAFLRLPQHNKLSDLYR
jgi:hypothetical protein